GAGDLDGAAAQLVEPRAALDGIHDPVPVGVAGHEDLGKGDELGALAGGLFDERAHFLDGGVRVQDHGGRLYGGDLDDGQVKHGFLDETVNERAGSDGDDGVAHGADAFDVGFNHVAGPQPFLRIAACAHAGGRARGDDVAGLERDA